MANLRPLPFLVIVVSLLLFLTFPGGVEGQAMGSTYFFMSEGKEKCFIESVPAQVPITVSYENPNNPGVSCSIAFREPSQRTVYSREVSHEQPKGRVTYLSQVAGDHAVCIVCPSTQWLATSLLRWSLTIDLGDTEMGMRSSFNEIARSHDLDKLNAVMKKTLEMMDTLEAENDFERAQEEAARGATEKAHHRVLLFVAIQVAVMAVAALFSVYHLKNFFHAQKLF